MEIQINEYSINIIEIIITLLATFIAFISFYYQRRTQRENLIHNLSMERINLYEKKYKETEEAYIERIINFYEYVSLLILKGRIDKKIAMELFKEDIQNIFKEYAKKIKENGCWKDIIKLNDIWSDNNMRKGVINFNEEKKFISIKDFLNENSLNLVALSVFLLVAITLSSHEGMLSHPLGVLSAGISYFLMIDLIKKDTGRDSINLGIMKSFITLFAILFCIWVILNLVIPFQNNFDIIMLILWLIFILGIPIKLYTS